MAELVIDGLENLDDLAGQLFVFHGGAPEDAGQECGRG
jgi:hypothetical protein